MVLSLPGTGHARTYGLLLLLKWVVRMFESKESKERRVPVVVTPRRGHESTRGRGSSSCKFSSQKALE